MKRRLLKLCVFLLLGAIVNAAVSWGLAVRPIRNDSFLSRDDRFLRRVNTPSGGLNTHVRRVSGEFWLLQAWDTFGSDLSHRVDENAYQAALPWWSRCRDTEPAVELDAREASYSVYWEFGTGWPLLSLRCWSVDRWGDPHGVVMSGGVLQLPTDWRNAHRSPRTIVPCIAILPGFAINTILYGTVCWLVFAVPFTLRLHLRIRRNLCPHCAYPIGTNDVCTECGKAVTLRPMDKIK
jgi:hypothetical protein